MWSDYGFDVIGSLKLLHNFTSEEPACPSWVLFPCLDLVFRVGPHEVANRAWGGELGVAVEGSDGVDGGAFGGEAAMDTENISLYNGG